MRVTVLGGGRVGGAIALDLARSGGFEVTVADASAAALGRFAEASGVRALRADLARPEEVRRVVADADLVVGAVPGFMGFATLRTVIEAGKNTVDISFFDEDAFLLDALAKELGVVAIVDCGVAPGLSNLLVGYHAARLEQVDEFLCYVGGLPAVRTWPWEYKAGFSPIDVLEEYTRPARLVERGEVVTRPALSEPELLDFPGIGTLEAFNTDGLRSVLRTIRCPNMKEKTLRYPGHIEKMRVLREAGFFGKEPIDVAGARVRPIDLTARLLFPMWQFGEGEADLTVMRVEVRGKARDDGREHHVYDLLDRYDPATQTTSMARTTGYTATAAVHLLAHGHWTRPGIAPPEFLGESETCLHSVIRHLSDRGVHLRARATD